MYLQWLLQREEVLTLFLQRGDNESSWIMSYCHSVAFPFASCNLFIDTKSYECLAIPLASGLADKRRAQEMDGVCRCLFSLASANSWWKQFQPSENTTEGFHFFASGKSSSCYLLSSVVNYATDSVLSQWRSSLYSLLAGCYWTLTVSRGVGLSLAVFPFTSPIPTSFSLNLCSDCSQVATTCFLPLLSSSAHVDILWHFLWLALLSHSLLNELESHIPQTTLPLIRESPWLKSYPWPPRLHILT